MYCKSMNELGENKREHVLKLWWKHTLIAYSEDIKKDRLTYLRLICLKFKNKRFYRERYYK